MVDITKKFKKVKKTIEVEEVEGYTLHLSPIEAKILKSVIGDIGSSAVFEGVDVGTVLYDIWGAMDESGLKTRSFFKTVYMEKNNG